jgi:hypothetical protein
MRILPHEQMTCARQTCDKNRMASDPSLQDLEVENMRLRMMITELLTKNQSLRWKLQNALTGHDSPSRV